MLLVFLLLGKRKGLEVCQDEEEEEEEEVLRYFYVVDPREIRLCLFQILDSGGTGEKKPTESKIKHDTIAVTLPFRKH